tara:strand:- start:826 stop:1044 length:219 start_codon:yes stop_codon:yes gene_type:complete
MPLVVNAETPVFKEEIPSRRCFPYLARITADFSIGSFDVGLEYTLICSFDKTETKVGIVGSLYPGPWDCPNG